MLVVQLQKPRQIEECVWPLNDVHFFSVPEGLSPIGLVRLSAGQLNDTIQHVVK